VRFATAKRFAIWNIMFAVKALLMKMVLFVLMNHEAFV